MTKKKLWTLLLACAGVLAGGPPVRAQGTIPDQPQLGDISPPSARRGTTVEISLSGQRLAGATGLICRYSSFPGMVPFRDAGLKAEQVSAPSDGQAKAKLTIPPDAPPGLHQIRCITAQGVTTPAYFYVSQFDQQPEKEPNNVLAQANPVTLPATMAGVVQQGEDHDCYSFSVKAGETVVFDVEGFKRFAPPQNQQNGISYLDSFLSLRDSSGREIAYADDDTRLDAFLAYKFPADGTYCIAVRDNEYRGRGDFHYRLSLAKAPAVTAIFPPGGQAGGKAVVTVFGYNLDASGATTVKRSVDFAQAPGVSEFRVTTAAGVSNAVPVVSDAVAEAPEAEPNDRIQEGTQVVLPCTCSGKFDRLDDVDAFRFQGQAGQRLIFQVSASRLGSPVDTVVTLMSRSGTVIARDDDGGGMPDSRLDVTLPRTDEYAVFVRNQVRSGAGPQQFYRLSIRPPRPSFNAVLRQDGRDPRGNPTKVDTDSITVTQGSSTEFDLVVNRSEGQGGDVTVAMSAPSSVKGLKFEQLIKTKIEGSDRNGNPAQFKTSIEKGVPTIKNGQTTIPCQFAAAADAPPGTVLSVTLQLTGVTGSQMTTVTKPVLITVAPK